MEHTNHKAFLHVLLCYSNYTTATSLHITGDTSYSCNRLQVQLKYSLECTGPPNAGYIFLSLAIIIKPYCCLKIKFSLHDTHHTCRLPLRVTYHTLHPTTVLVGHLQGGRSQYPNRCKDNNRPLEHSQVVRGTRL